MIKLIAVDDWLDL